MGTSGFRAGWLVWALALGCSDDASDPYYDGLDPSLPPPSGPDLIPVPSAVFPEREILTDVRPVQTAATPPRPISGGTLLVTRDGQRAIAADPERNRVSIVGIPEKALLFTVALEPGDEPGRLAEDGAGRVHVALRRGGALVTIDIQSGTVVARRSVCGAPRGVAYEPQTDQVHVACAGGTLVTLPASGGEATRRLELGVDLRDVVVRSDGVWVSRFKSASVFRIDALGTVVQSVVLGSVMRQTERFDEFGNQALVGETVQASVAWRMLPTFDGDGVMLLHQYGLDEPIDLEEEPPPGPIATGSYGAPMGGCGGLVQAAVSTLDAQGGGRKGVPISAPVLAVDAALSPDGMWIALAHAGPRDPEAPFADGMPGVLGQVTLIDAVQTSLQGTPAACAHPNITLPIDGQTTAVAFNPLAHAEVDGTWILVQTREPARLVLMRDPVSQESAVIELGGPTLRDTGHDIFHRDSGAGIACASCHAEGGEDGRVWKFLPLGDRRTQAIHVGLAGTTPFHWDGDMTDLDMLMEEVFVGRMGGPRQTPARIDALASWMFTLQPPAPIVDPSSEGAMRGRALFESASVGCVDCHSGDKLTNNQSVGVGTTEAGHLLQVPSLVGIGYRAPFLHTGCAATLAARFDPACGGGDAHGRTSQLTAAEMGDLVLYLQSL